MIVFLEVTPRWPLPATVVRVCSAADRRAQTWDGHRWAAALYDPGTLSVSLFTGDLGAAIDSGSSPIVIAETALLQLFPAAETIRWESALVRMWAGTFTTSPGGAYPYENTVTQVFSGKVSRFEKDGGAIKLTLDARGEAGDTKVLNREYAGTGDAEGGLDLKGRLKPWVFGAAKNVEPVLIDTDNSVYQFSGYGAILGVDALYERGASFGASIGDYADYAALVAATIPAGRWGTCLAEGLVRLGAPQFGVITGDVEGDTVGGTFWRLTGEILQRIADERDIDPATIDTASLDALDDFASGLPNGGVINLVLTEQTTFLDLARRLCAPLNAQAGYSLLGKLFACRVAIGTPSFTIDSMGRRLPIAANFIEADTPPPFKKIVMAAETSWRVHDLSTEVAFYADIIPVGNYSATETYREGNVVTLPDGSTWLYTNPTATSGNYPPDSPSYWASLSSGGVQTIRVPDPPPEDPPEGTLYFDDVNNQFRFEGLALVFEGEPILFEGDPVDGPGYVYVVPDALGNNAYVVTIAPPLTQTIYKDFAGTQLPGQFPPRVLTPAVSQGGVDIRTGNQVQYSITTSGVTATINNIAGSPDKGRITVTAGGIGHIMLSVTVDGVAYPAYKIQFVLQQAAAPNPGGTGSKSGSDSTFPYLTSGSFTETAGPFTVTVGSGEDISCAFPATYAVNDTGFATSSLVGKWQSSPAGAGTWTDAPGSPIEGSEASFDPETFDSDAGYGLFNQTITGLSAGDYDVRFVAALDIVLGTPSLEIFGSTATVLVQ